MTPILRADVDCYPNQEGPEFDECYALAFGVPAALMVVALSKSAFFSTRVTKSVRQKAKMFHIRQAITGLDVRIPHYTLKE